VRSAQVLVAFAAVLLSPLIGLVAPLLAFFVVASGLSGLSAATWHRSAVASVLLSALQVAALAGSAFIVLQSATSDLPTPPPTAQIPAGAGSIPPTDRAAP
jgi:hypothetical protein